MDSDCSRVPVLECFGGFESIFLKVNLGETDVFDPNFGHVLDATFVGGTVEDFCFLGYSSRSQESGRGDEKQVIGKVLTMESKVKLPWTIHHCS